MKNRYKYKIDHREYYKNYLSNTAEKLQRAI